MQEIIKKIKERLEEYLINNKYEENSGFIEECIEIVNQVAEEYNQSLTNDGWIPFTEREADDEEKEAYGCHFHSHISRRESNYERT